MPKSVPKLTSGKDENVALCFTLLSAQSQTIGKIFSKILEVEKNIKAKIRIC